MDCNGDDESQRQALRSLSRRELQSRAKDLNVRANRKSIDIIEGIINASRSRKYRRVVSGGEHPP